MSSKSLNSSSKFSFSKISFNGRNSGIDDSLHSRKAMNPNVHPVLIIPGIMGSGLEVRKSAVDPRYAGERVWLNPIAAGLGKIQRGKSFKSSLDGSTKGDNLDLMSTSRRGRARLDGRPSMREFRAFRKPMNSTITKYEEEEVSFELAPSNQVFNVSRKNLKSKRKGKGSVRNLVVNVRKRPSIVKHFALQNYVPSDSDSESDNASFTEYGLGREESVSNLDCKSDWLQHMSLTSDMCTERMGNEIRPIPGLKGVDFLTDIANVKVGASYVFAPVIKLLRGCGYVKGVNLDACPYDWRVPPSILEERDGYFTETMERIERMVDDCDGKPVVLLCHSMGGKCGHYLLNFVLEAKGPVEGRKWLDEHIHTYMPLGAAHIGVPAILASTFTAELNPAFDSLVTMQERMVFSRSLGSAVWLMPTTLPSIERNAPPAILCKREGKLTIKIVASEENPLGDLRKLVENKIGSRHVNRFQIKVAYGDKTRVGENVIKVRSGESIPVPDPFPKRNKPNAQYFDLPSEQFIFSTPGSLLGVDGDDFDTSPLKPIRFTIMELGDINSYRLEPKGKCLTWLFKFSPGQRKAIIGNAIAKKAGKFKTILARSSYIENIDVQRLVEAGDKGLTIKVPLVASADMFKLDRVLTQTNRCIEMTVNIKWEPPPSCDKDDIANPIAMIPSIDKNVNDSDTKSSKRKKKKKKKKPAYFAPVPEVVSTMDDNSEYVPLSGQAILREEGLEDSFIALSRDRYSPQLDHVGPRDKSAYDRPPVKRVYAIYGTNLETAVSKVCKRVTSYLEDNTAEERIARPYFEVDTDTCLDSGTDISQSGHTLENGTLFEFAGTPQIDLRTGETIYRSGDGSVPYYCLQQSSVWAKEVEDDPDTTDKVLVQELEGAEHRAIIADQRFHRLLVDYLTGKTEI